MKDVLSEAGIEVDESNKKDVDRAIHEIVGVDYKDCPQAWRRVKETISEERGRREFVNRLRAAG